MKAPDATLMLVLFFSVGLAKETIAQNTAAQDTTFNAAHAAI